MVFEETSMFFLVLRSPSSKYGVHHSVTSDRCFLMGGCRHTAELGSQTEKGAKSRNGCWRILADLFAINGWYVSWSYRPKMINSTGILLNFIQLTCNVEVDGKMKNFIYFLFKVLHLFFDTLLPLHSHGFKTLGNWKTICTWDPKQPV